MLGIADVYDIGACFCLQGPPRINDIIWLPSVAGFAEVDDIVACSCLQGPQGIDGIYLKTLRLSGALSIMCPRVYLFHVVYY